MKQKVKRDRIEVSGIVLQAHRAGLFSVQLTDSDVVIIATLSGKMRENFIKIVAGDSVLMQLSEYDLTRGRIVSREKR